MNFSNRYDNTQFFLKLEINAALCDATVVTDMANDYKRKVP